MARPPAAAERAGFNCVETYTFWNFHEPRENQWDFAGDRDLGGFLDAAKELGLYAIVRVGPYVCAECDSGGYPVWLKFKPPMKIRTADPEYLKWNDHWYDKYFADRRGPSDPQGRERDHGAIGK